VLFYQALALQAGPGGHVALLGGLLTGAVALVVLSWVIVRGIVRLPLGVFFGASSVLIAVLAVILTGKGIAALQEAGWLPIHAVNVPSLPVLGLYPNLQGLLIQAALVLVIVAGFAYTSQRRSDGGRVRHAIRNPPASPGAAAAVDRGAWLRYT
jgi:high-affinity iron transporter